MPVHHSTLTIHTRSQGLHEITALVGREVARSGVRSGIATVFCHLWEHRRAPHTREVLVTVMGDGDIPG